MKRFLVLLFLLSFGLPSFAYIDRFIEGRRIVWNAPKSNIFKDFDLPNIDKIEITTCNKDNECVVNLFYKIDNTFATNEEGQILNYRTGRFVDTKVIY